MKGIIILADGFEDTEALTTIDILRRAKIQIEMVSLKNELQVLTSHGINVICEKLIKNVNLDDYDFLVITGGAAIFKHLSKMPEVDNIIHHFMHKNQLVSCICAAPMLLGKLGYLENKDYVCFSGCEDDSFKGNYKNELGVVKTSNIITAKSMFYTIDFALAIVEFLIGKDIALQVKKEIMSDFNEEE